MCDPFQDWKHSTQSVADKDRQPAAGRQADRRLPLGVATLSIFSWHAVWLPGGAIGVVSSSSANYLPLISAAGGGAAVAGAARDF